MIPALGFKVEYRGGPRLFERLGRSVRDLRPVWPEVAAAFKEQQRGLFAGEGAEAGGWKPLSPAYARAKSRSHPGRRILQRSGALEAAATGRSDDFQVIAQPLLLIAQVRTYYAGWIDRQRELSPLTEARVRAWIRLVDAYIARAGSGA